MGDETGIVEKTKGEETNRFPTTLFKAMTEEAVESNLSINNYLLPDTFF